MNQGSFKNFLDTGASNGTSSMTWQGIPRRALPLPVASQIEPQAQVTVGPTANSKSTLRKTIEDHDRVYHKNGYVPGDKCKFREALMRGDDIDVVGEEEGEEPVEKIGVLRYTEDKDGKISFVGVEELQKVLAYLKNVEKEALVES